ncbi:MAG: type I phosphomannose isomerase catalytic subunit [Pirellulales bacterium]|jgi:mannose-6-phosphate isomerase
MLHPLFLVPVYRRYLWGGRRFETALSRTLPPGEDYAESWELVDRDADQSIVACGALAGRSLADLRATECRGLLGRHADLERFPLLFKFLDARLDLSVQVHPDDSRAARLVPPDRGKTEAWYVIDAAPGSRIYAGLRDGIDRDGLAAALRAGRCEEVLHSFEPRPGDCVFIPAGTVHAIGGGLLVAEIQQSSDVTYRLHDWNRTGADGKPRPLHLDAGLEAVTRFGPVGPVAPTRTADPAARKLVDCPYFRFDDVHARQAWTVGGDDACHAIVVLGGTIAFSPEWDLPPLRRGSTALLPAGIGPQTLTPADGLPAHLLHVSLP